MPTHKELAGGHLIRSIKTANGYDLRYSDDDLAGLYTYQATVERVIDGDTMLVNIDCGFDLWMVERLRLRGINAPETSTMEGKRAKTAVTERLAAVHFIVIKTYPYEGEKYGRFIADVFYLPGESDPQKVAAKGRYLNQELLDDGMAEGYEL